MTLTTSTAPLPCDDFRSRLASVKRLLISDIDNTLLGDRQALKELVNYLTVTASDVGFGIATGRHLESARDILEAWQVPLPDLWITSVGSEIHYGVSMQPDRIWNRHIHDRWQPKLVKAAMAKLAGIELQSSVQQRPHKISYLVNTKTAPSLPEIQAYLKQQQLHINAIYSHGEFLDLLPWRASKGAAVNHVASRWGFPLSQILVAGDSGNDEQMLIGSTRAVVVGNYSPELEKLRGQDHIYFANGCYAQGILEAIAHYSF